MLAAPRGVYWVAISAKRKTFAVGMTIFAGAGATSRPPDPDLAKLAQSNGSPARDCLVGWPVVSWIPVAVVVVKANKLGGSVY